MKKVHLHLLPKGNSIHCGPAFPKYIEYILQREIDLPDHVIQKGVVLEFMPNGSTFRVYVEEIHFSVSRATTHLMCSYCSKDFIELGVFNKQAYFDDLTTQLLSDGWVISPETE